MAGDEPRTRKCAGPPVGRRRFLAAVGGASAAGQALQSVAAGSSTAGSRSVDDADSTHFTEATLEFELRDETITPARRSGPRPYTATRSERRLLVHATLAQSAHRALLDADAVVFGLESFRSAPAVFTRGTEDVLPVAGSATPHRTRFIRLDAWDGAPSYRVRTAGDRNAGAAEGGTDETAEPGTVAVQVADQTVAVPRDDATTVRLDDRKIPAEHVPGYEQADAMTVTPRLEVRNYGCLAVCDATDCDRHNA
ncbi:hypothetical protein [Halobacterium zhouii]|uniref:hypothetical protein n=1 Tax=Halobacterium zhouii TaxID=2902624 RepID=UPI001E29AE4A|nr:hypothetical protein [Halobacterium zhouii]